MNNTIKRSLSDNSLITFSSDIGTDDIDDTKSEKNTRCNKKKRCDLVINSEIIDFLLSERKKAIGSDKSDDETNDVDVNIEIIYCPKCSCVCKNIMELFDHDLIVHEKAFDNIEFDDIDNGDTDSDTDSDNGNDQVDDDVIPTSKNGKYACSKCSKKYMTPMYLGEHFIIAHGKYEEQVELDTVKKDKYPGLDILKEINMINILPEKIISKMIADNDTCIVCCNNFETNKEYNIDDNINFPIKMSCCSAIICCKCVKGFTEIKGIYCPHCLTDHTKIDSDYLRICE